MNRARGAARPEVRSAVAADLPAIDSIYREAVAQRFQTADLSPPTEAERSAWFAAHQDPRYPVRVATIDGAVIGYATLSPWRAGREATRCTAELSYYVAGAWRGRGVGRALAEDALVCARAIGHTALLGIVIDGNRASIALLERLGFRVWGRLPGVVRCHGEVRAHLIFGRSVHLAPGAEERGDPST